MVSMVTTLIIPALSLLLVLSITRLPNWKVQFERLRLLGLGLLISYFFITFSFLFSLTIGRSFAVPELKVMLYGAIIAIVICLSTLARPELVGRQIEKTGALVFSGIWLILFLSG